MKPRPAASPAPRYDQVGVLTNQDLGLEGLLRSVRQTEAFRHGRPAGRSVLDVGYFANVIDLGHGLGLAMTTDGVGSKVLVAEMMDRYDTIGIDCVAMNVNDLICVGAEPVSMLDYVGIERATPAVLEAIGVGLLAGARQAGINIVGGEISQLPEILRGTREGSGLDLVGMCVGTVPLDRVNVGAAVAPGDVILGLASTGLHSNGYTLARRVLFAYAGLKPDTHVEELGRTAGEELLVPTRIYVAPVLDLLAQDLPLHAMINITSDGLLNLARVKPAVGFRMDHLPEPQPVFRLIQRLGGVDLAEMYRVFNMGVGFCLIVPPEERVIEAVRATLHRHDVPCFVLGEVVADARRRVIIPDLALVGEGDWFHSEA